MTDSISSTVNHAGLKALFINCTLNPTPQKSHTETLLRVAMDIMQKQGVHVELLRAVDYMLAPGVQPDMTKMGAARDDWPDVYAQVKAADILVIGTPIWLGEQSSVCSRVIERLYAQSADLNEKGQYDYYGKVGGCIITGNEDGLKHVAKSLLYAMQHIGYTIPPQADAGWVGEAGPGPSYGDETPQGPAGSGNKFTQRNTAFMAWNLMHMAKLLKSAGGFPAYGNLPKAWEEKESQ